MNPCISCGSRLSEREEIPDLGYVCTTVKCLKEACETLSAYVASLDDMEESFLEEDRLAKLNGGSEGVKSVGHQTAL